MKYNPEEDSITHINIYSKSKSDLGKFLTNFSYSPIITEDGKFNSIESYWYYLSTNIKWEQLRLRRLSGFEAKKYGQAIKNPTRIDENDFKRKIKLAINYKIINSDYYEEFIKSELPFTHYYNFGGKVVEPVQHHWLVEYFEELREKLKINL